MDINNYLIEIEKKPLWDLVLTYAFADRQMEIITSEQFFEVLNAVDKKYFPPEQAQTTAYLFKLREKATPQTLKEAKKSLKGYMEYLIYKDQQSGKIRLSEANAAKEMLTQFLTQNNAAMKQD